MNEKDGIDISYIIVSWNAKDFLFKCLMSIQKDSVGSDSEIIVVDNASSDGSPEMVAEQFPNAQLLRNTENLGFARANNIGIGQSRGRYLAFINSDVEVLQGCISLMMDYIEKHEDIGILGPQILETDGSVQPSCREAPTLWNSFCRALALDMVFPKKKLFGNHMMTYWPHDEIASVDIIVGCFWLVRRQALDEVGALDERFFIYGEDWDWCKRFRKGGWKVVYFNKAKAIHYGGASSANAPVKFFIEMHRANLRYWDKHHGRSARLAYFLIMLLHHQIRLTGAVIKYVIRPSERMYTGFTIKRSRKLIEWLLSFDIEQKV